MLQIIVVVSVFLTLAIIMLLGTMSSTYKYDSNLYRKALK